MRNIERTQNIAVILNLEWTSGSMRSSGNAMEAGASTLTHTVEPEELARFEGEGGRVPRLSSVSELPAS